MYTSPFISGERLSSGIAVLENNFSEYEALASPILDEVRTLEAQDNTPQISSIEGYVFTGTDKHVFKVETPSGPKALKIITGLPGSVYYSQISYGEVTVRNAAPLLVGAGVQNLEQIHAVDKQNGVLVTTFEPGELLPKIPTAELRRQITDEHITQLSTTLREMRARHLHFHNAGGVLLGESGFRFVDYTFEDDESNRTIRLPYSAAGLLSYLLRDHQRQEDIKRATGSALLGRALSATGVRTLHRLAIVGRAARLEASSK